MGLLDSLLSYVDSRKRVAGSNLADIRDNPRAALTGLLSTQPEEAAERQRRHLATSRRLESGGGLLGGSVMPGVDKVTDSPEFEAAMNAPLGLLGWTAYHGSPHKFDKFKLDKIGTGEGAQAYGHGLYFADNPSTAMSYKEGLSRGKNATIEGAGATADIPTWLASKIQAEGLDGAIADWSRRVAEESATLKTSQQPWLVEERVRNLSAQLDSMKKMKAARDVNVSMPGAMYKVDIDDARAPKDAFLDWDKPLSQQPAKVRKFFEPYVAPMRKEMKQGDAAWGDLGGPENVDELFTGQQLMGLLKSGDASVQNIIGGGGPAISEKLKRAGIPGIRYLDAGSRGSGGTYNTVLFDDELVKILERN
jgi:hypothetical protein